MKRSELDDAARLPRKIAGSAIGTVIDGQLMGMARHPLSPAHAASLGTIVRCAASVLGSALLLHCSSIDERTPGIDEPESGMGAEPGEQQAMPTLQPAPGAAGAAAVNGSEGNPAAAAGVGSPAQEPGAGLEPLARGAECTAEQACQGGLVCGRSATPDIGTGRVCCDQACEGSCQGCSVGLNAGTCAPVGNDVSCVAASSLEGACSEPGVCTEYCVVGQSLLGQCLVEPG